MWLPTLLQQTSQTLVQFAHSKMNKAIFFQTRPRDAYPRETVISMVWLCFGIIPAFKFLICKMQEGAWHMLSKFPGSSHEVY